jgi:hypothetical protein
MWPAFAYLSLWMIVGGNLAEAAFMIALEAPEMSELVETVIQMMSDDSWKACEGTRMKNAFEFVSNAWAVDPDVGAPISCMLATYVNAPIQLMAIKFLKWESTHHRHPATARQLQNLKQQKKGEAEPADESDLPCGVKLASGEGIRKCLQAGAQVIVFPM